MNIVLQYHTSFKAKSSAARRQWLLDTCQARPLLTRNGFGMTVTINDEQHTRPVCNDCFANMYGISRSTVQRWLRKSRDGVVRVIPTTVPRSDTTLKKEQAKAWLTETYLKYGDYMPDEQTIVLPVYTKQELFNWFYGKLHDTDTYKYPEFCACVREEFPFISFRRFKKFTQCKFCNACDQRLTKTLVHFPSLIPEILTFIIL